jgi:hypothetical protein
MIGITVPENIDMFRRAWTTVAVPKYCPNRDTSVAESQRIWLEEFGCRMIFGKTGFLTAEFDNEADYTAFILRWS